MLTRNEYENLSRIAREYPAGSLTGDMARIAIKGQEAPPPSAHETFCLMTVPLPNGVYAYDPSDDGPEVAVIRLIGGVTY